jgi:hypothetical protein
MSSTAPIGEDLAQSLSAARTPRSKIAPLGLAELPAPPSSTWKIVGPGIVAAGVGLGSSEFILFPFIASKVGLAFLWAAVLGVVLQYFLNMEIERYALATGETVITGFNRLGRHWGLVMVVMVLLTAIWPGWAASSATLLTYLTGGDVAIIAIVMLIACAVMLTLSPVVYRTLERTLVLKVIAVGLLFAGALLFAVPGEAAVDGARMAVAPVLPVEALGWAVILGAVAFAGMGGVGNLCQSNWIRDKGFGMGIHAPRIVSPLLGEPVAAAGTGWRFEIGEESLRRWKGWWRVANIEQLATFVLISILTIGLTSLIAYALLRGQPSLPDGLGFLRVQGEVLGERIGPWFGGLFWIVGAFALFGTQVGIIDIVSRLSADVIHTGYGRGRSESFVYMVTVWALALTGVAGIAVGMDQPLLLVILSACVAGFAMFVYSPLLILLNHRLLPRPLRPGWPRIAALILATLVFGAASVATIADQVARFG